MQDIHDIRETAVAIGMIDSAVAAEKFVCKKIKKFSHQIQEKIMSGEKFRRTTI